MPIGTTPDVQAINQRPAAPTPTAQAASPPLRVVVPKVATVSPRNPDTLAQNVTAGSAGAGATLAGLRFGYGPTATTLKANSTQPILGVAGAEGGAAQTADAGAHTLFPSQFCFPTTKYHNAARLRGMA